jgi:citrate synthase
VSSPRVAPPGLDGVIAVQTRLSHVDGQNGVLIIGGYQLDEIAGRVSFGEAAHAPPSNLEVMRLLHRVGIALSTKTRGGVSEITFVRKQHAAESSLLMIRSR